MPAFHGPDRTPERGAAINPGPTSEPVLLDGFEPAVARAVVTTLRAEGIPAAPDDDGDEVAVYVPGGRREAALAVLAAHMDDVRALAADDRQSAASDVDSSERERPLLFERLRNLGFIPVALAPLLVVTLANVQLPGAYTLAVLVGGMVALIAWRNGRRER